MPGEILDQYRGCLLGLAAGDALGMPVERESAKEIEKLYGLVTEMMPAPKGHSQYGLLAGQFTDDTEQTLLLAEALLESRSFDLEIFVEKLVEWGKIWIENPEMNRGVGPTSRAAIEQLIANNCWKESGGIIPTCGSAMRVASIGLVYHRDLDLVFRYAEQQSLPTHISPAARAGAVAMAIGVALSILGLPRFEVIEQASSYSKRIDKEFAYHLTRAGELVDLELSEAIVEIGNSSLVNETVPAAFYCYLKFEPEDALIMAASSGGDTDSIAAMTGALVGATYGLDWLPMRWLACLEDCERILRIAADLVALSSQLGLLTTYGSSGV